MTAKGESRSKDILIRKLIMMEDDGWEEEDRGKTGGDKAGKVAGRRESLLFSC